jgi:hypothetical protein
MLPNLLSPETHALQSSLARICRTGLLEPLPGIHSEQRIITYREIVLTAFSNSLARAYPIAKRALGDSDWERLVKLFIAEHDVLPVELWKMPEGLYEFVCSGQVPSELCPEYLPDLLLFEWLEIAVTMMEDISLDYVPECHDDPVPLTWEEDGSRTVFVNPHFEIIKIGYPLYKFKPSDAIAYPGEYFVVCYRHCDTLKPHYLTVSPFIAQCLLTLKEHAISLEQVTDEICADFDLTLDEQAKQSLISFVREGLSSGIILCMDNSR